MVLGSRTHCVYRHHPSGGWVSFALLGLLVLVARSLSRFAMRCCQPKMRNYLWAFRKIIVFGGASYDIPIFPRIIFMRCRTQCERTKLKRDWDRERKRERECMWCASLFWGVVRERLGAKIQTITRAKTFRSGNNNLTVIKLAT